jgi:hypothetical protein
VSDALPLCICHVWLANTPHNCYTLLKLEQRNYSRVVIT